MAGSENSSNALPPDADINDIQADIARTRVELGETVEALSDRLDVPQRAKERVHESRDRLVERSREAKDMVVQGAGNARPDNPAVTAAVVVAALAAVGALVWLRRR